MLVLWVLALLIIIAIGLTATQRTETALAGSQLATAQFRATAEAGIGWSVLNLLAPETAFDEEEAQGWIPDGEAHPWAFAGESLEIKVSNEASRIDLNKASRDLLEDLLKAAGLAEDEASAIADAIEDWRDTNDLTELQGAEDSDYEDAGRSYGAKDGPFDSVEELQLVLGVDRNLYRTLKPAVTVDSSRATPTEEFAPPLVQAALQGISPEEVELEQDEHARATESGDSKIGSVGRGGPLYRIRVTSMLEGRAGLTMEALVNVQARGEEPFAVLWRRFGLIAEGSVAASEEEGEAAGGF